MVKLLGLCRQVCCAAGSLHGGSEAVAEGGLVRGGRCPYSRHQ